MASADTSEAFSTVQNTVFQNIVRDLKGILKVKFYLFYDSSASDTN